MSRMVVLVREREGMNWHIQSPEAETRRHMDAICGAGASGVPLTWRRAEIDGLRVYFTLESMGAEVAVTADTCPECAVRFR